MKLLVTDLGRTALHLAAGAGQAVTSEFLLVGEEGDDAIGAGMDPNQASLHAKVCTVHSTESVQRSVCTDHDPQVHSSCYIALFTRGGWNYGSH